MIIKIDLSEMTLKEARRVMKVVMLESKAQRKLESVDAEFAKQVPIPSWVS